MHFQAHTYTFALSCIWITRIPSAHCFPESNDLASGTRMCWCVQTSKASSSENCPSSVYCDDKWGCSTTHCLLDVTVVPPLFHQRTHTTLFRSLSRRRLSAVDVPAWLFLLTQTHQDWNPFFVFFLIIFMFLFTFYFFFLAVLLVSFSLDTSSSSSALHFSPRKFPLALCTYGFPCCLLHNHPKGTHLPLFHLLFYCLLRIFFNIP